MQQTQLDTNPEKHKNIPQTKNEGKSKKKHEVENGSTTDPTHGKIT